jgi:hypothetical protein
LFFRKIGCKTQLGVVDTQGNVLFNIKNPLIFNSTGQVEFKVSWNRIN